MIGDVGHHRPDHAEVVGALADVLEDLADLQPAPAVLLERDTATCRPCPSSARSAGWIGEDLAVLPGQLGLGVEGVDLADGPPFMNRWITRFAFGAKWGALGASGDWPRPRVGRRRGAGGQHPRRRPAGRPGRASRTPSPIRRSMSRRLGESCGSRASCEVPRPCGSGSVIRMRSVDVEEFVREQEGLGVGLPRACQRPRARARGNSAREAQDGPELARRPRGQSTARIESVERMYRSQKPRRPSGSRPRKSSVSPRRTSTRPIVHLGLVRPGRPTSPEQARTAGDDPGADAVPLPRLGLDGRACRRRPPPCRPGRPSGSPWPCGRPARGGPPPGVEAGVARRPADRQLRARTARPRPSSAVNRPEADDPWRLVLVDPTTPAEAVVPGGDQPRRRPGRHGAWESVTPGRDLDLRARSWSSRPRTGGDTDALTRSSGLPAETTSGREARPRAATARRRTGCSAGRAPAAARSSRRSGVGSRCRGWGSRTSGRSGSRLYRSMKPYRARRVGNGSDSRAPTGLPPTAGSSRPAEASRASRIGSKSSRRRF